MAIRDFFSEKEFEGKLILNLDGNQQDLYQGELPKYFRSCYIRDRDLYKMVEQNKEDVREVLTNYILPDGKDYANIRSGDYGEMLCFLLIQGKYKINGIKLLGPKKWRWKSNKNKASEGTDIVFFHRKSKNPSSDDLVVSTEVKMKSTRNASNNPIQSAYKGAKNDKLGRLVKTFTWFKENFAKRNRPNLNNAIDRYIKPDVFGTYRKEFKAIAVIDSDFENAELAKDSSKIDDDGIDIWVISISKLKEIYENTFEQILNTNGN